MAQEFSLQRVLTTEERSGFYGRGSLCALDKLREHTAALEAVVTTANRGG